MSGANILAKKELTSTSISTTSKSRTKCTISFQPISQSPTQRSSFLRTRLMHLMALGKKLLQFSKKYSKKLGSGCGPQTWTLYCPKSLRGSCKRISRFAGALSSSKLRTIKISKNVTLKLSSIFSLSLKAAGSSELKLCFQSWWSWEQARKRPRNREMQAATC